MNNAGFGSAGRFLMALFPGFTQSLFQAVAGVARGGIPGAAWLDTGQVAPECLRDLERGAVRSIPSAAIRAAAQGLAPRGLVRRATGAGGERRRLADLGGTPASPVPDRMPPD
jgi:short-subunit dehydrogenase